MQGLNKSDRITEGDLRRLHRTTLEAPAQILGIFGRLRDQGTELRRGLNRQLAVETATVESVGDDRITLVTKGFEKQDDRQVFLSFELDGAGYLFASDVVGDPDRNRLVVQMPSVVFRSERRIADRRGAEAAFRVALASGDSGPFEGLVADLSGGGLGVEVSQAVEFKKRDPVEVRFLSGDLSGERRFGEIRHCSPSASKPGWVRLGLALGGTTSPLPVERRERIFSQSPFARLRDRLSVAGAAFDVATRAATRRLGWQESDVPSVPLVDYFTADGERIRAIVDCWGDVRGAPAVIIPPAFGKTKETLLPLASTIVASFRRAGEPVIVVRFDGIRRRGESHNDPECLEPGREYLHYAGSQAVKDVGATLDFLAQEYGVDKAVLVTFSAASSEGRKATATDTAGRICGWISVVGAPDAQSAMKKISGGIDYTRGLLRGVRFGKQEILGVLMDADHTGMDAIANGMATYDDAQRDMEAIDVPVTWVHGRYDAWMDGDRVRHLLSCGDPANRRFIEVPTGHQLRTSTEAFDIFRLIANEAAKMALGREIQTALPSLGALARRHRAERGRLPKPDVDVRALWADYLLGRDRTVGIELMTKSMIYQEFFREEIAALGLVGGESILDLGSGTGSLEEALATGHGAPDCSVYEMDFVRDALLRARSRANGGVVVQRYSVCADADARSIPAKDETFDCAFLSLVISYVEHPERVLKEVARVLRPGGRIVISTLRRDADISKIYEDGVSEFSPVRIREVFGDQVADADPDQLARNFLNDGARILSLEEQGRFRFWDRGELGDLVRACGFGRVRATHHLGDPPQALIVSARRS